MLLLACLRCLTLMRGSPFPMATLLRWPACSTRLDHTGRAARGPGPATVAACRGWRSRACSSYTACRRCLQAATHNDRRRHEAALHTAFSNLLTAISGM
jgi:hypothetical protein